MEKKERHIRVGFYVTSVSWANHQRWHHDTARGLWERSYPVEIISTSKGRLALRAGRQGIKVRHFKKRGVFLVDLLRLSSRLRKSGITTLFINYPGDLRLASAAARMAGIRNVIYRKGTVSRIRPNAINRYLLNHCVDTVVTNSRANRGMMVQQRGGLFQPGNTRVIYNGLDVSGGRQSSTPRHDYRKSGELLVGVIAGDIQEGSFFRLMELIRRSKNKPDHFRFLLHGNGHNFKSILERLRKRPALRQMLVWDSRSNNLGEFMKSIDVFLTGHTRNQLNHNLLRAMAHQKPLIAYDEGSNPEIVSHNENGYLLQKGDLNGIAEKLDVLRHEDLRIQLGRQARRSIEKQFDFKRTMDQIEDLLV